MLKINYSKDLEGASMPRFNLITSQQACEMLRVSRPTWNGIRAEFNLAEIPGPRRLLLFDKFEVLDKVVCGSPSRLTPVDLTFGNANAKIESIKFDENTIDLRAINAIDPYGALSLLAFIREMTSKGQPLNLIMDSREPVRYLAVVGLFKELRRSLNKFVFWNRSLTDAMNDQLSEILFPLKVIGYKGQDKSSAEELIKALIDQGFSETIVGYIGWILGELADNSLWRSTLLFPRCKIARTKKLSANWNSR